MTDVLATRCWSTGFAAACTMRSCSSVSRRSIGSGAPALSRVPRARSRRPSSCSALARAAASAAASGSSRSRTSNRCSRAESASATANWSGRRSSSAPSEETNVPAPCRLSRMFMASRERSASRTVGRLTPSASLRARSDGRRWPGSSRPSRIMSLIVLTVSAAKVVRARRLNSVERVVELTPALRETRDGVAQPVALEVLGVDVGLVRGLVRVLLVYEEDAWVARVAMGNVELHAGLGARGLEQPPERGGHRPLLSVLRGPGDAHGVGHSMFSFALSLSAFDVPRASVRTQHEVTPAVGHVVERDRCERLDERAATRRVELVLESAIHDHGVARRQRAGLALDADRDVALEDQHHLLGVLVSVPGHLLPGLVGDPAEQHLLTADRPQVNPAGELVGLDAGEAAEGGAHGTTSAASRCSSARSTFSGVIGRSVICTPMASVTAFAIAGIGELAVISPTPLAPNGPLAEAISSTVDSISGSSAAPGMR